jgi:hypothetical protein
MVVVALCNRNGGGCPVQWKWWWLPCAMEMLGLALFMQVRKRSTCLGSLLSYPA